MKKKGMQVELAKKGTNLEMLARKVIQKPQLLPEIFDGLCDDKARVRYGCLKVLRIISEKEPGILYPEFAHFVALLDSPTNILKWGAIIIISNLAAVDSEKKIDAVLEKYLAPISEHVMITAANVIVGSGRIAAAKPYLADRIARAILQVEKGTYQTDECRNVACGHAIESFGKIFTHITDQKPVVDFVRRQLCNSRNAVRSKAANFLKKYGLPEETWRAPLLQRGSG